MLSVVSNKTLKRTHSADLNSKMPRNIMTKSEIKAKVEKLYHQVDKEPSKVWQGEKDLAHKYLRRVLDIIDEYRD